MTEKSSDNFLDPKLRERLLRENKSPFRGIRRILWIALFGSAFIGLFIMSTRLISGEIVAAQDLLIQFVASLLFGFLLLIDRHQN